MKFQRQQPGKAMVIVNVDPGGGSGSVSIAYVGVCTFNKEDASELVYVLREAANVVEGKFK